MDLMQWIPTPLRAARKGMQSSHRNEQRDFDGLHADQVLMFNTSGQMNAHTRHSAMGSALASPILLGVGDSLAVPYGEVDKPGRFTSELLGTCQRVAEKQLVNRRRDSGDHSTSSSKREEYKGPIHLLQKAYKATRSSGCTTLGLATIDNSTLIHGQPHPMVAVLSIGGCELLQLRRRNCDKHGVPLSKKGEANPEGMFVFEEIFRAPPRESYIGHQGTISKPQQGHMDVACMLEKSEIQNCVRCMSARRGDLIILASRGVLPECSDDILKWFNSALPSSSGHGFSPASAALLGELACRIAKEHLGQSVWREPFGGNSVVVAEIVEDTRRKPVSGERAAIGTTAPSSSASSSVWKSCTGKRKPSLDMLPVFESKRFPSLERAIAIEGPLEAYHVRCGLGLGACRLAVHADMPTDSSSDAAMQQISFARADSLI